MSSDLNSGGLKLCSGELWLKQLDVEVMSDLGRLVLPSAFPQFMDSDAYRAGLLARSKANRYADLVNGLDVGAPRRWAGDFGDQSLPRGRYHTLCDSEGGDHGTLLRELYAYCDFATTGPVLLHELDVRSMDLPDKDILRSHKAIAAGFPPYHGKAHPFAQAQGVSDAHSVFYVLLAVRVQRVQVERLLDLRHPELADAFAHWASRMGNDDIPEFRFRPEVDRFFEVLPTLLTQARGGGMFTKIVATSLRRGGVGGVVFPSARFDATVTVEHGRVIASRGWNFVDYRGAPLPKAGLFEIDESDSWDQCVLEREGGIGFHDRGQVHLCDGVRLEVNPPGPSAGTWRIHGMSALQDRRIESVLEQYGIVWMRS